MSQYPIPQDKQQAFVSFAPQGAEREKVSAERVRELISSVWVQSSERVVAGVAFNKFDIVGQLDLSNLGDANHPLPRLIFHSCQFDQIRARTLPQCSGCMSKRAEACICFTATSSSESISTRRN